MKQAVSPGGEEKVTSMNAGGPHGPMELGRGRSTGADGEQVLRLW
ncbi:hypothetical protein [Streptomyces sp. JJ36]|nr:hypothetical protein [Streptomyces sp. JJ36]